MKIAIIDADLIGRKRHRFPNLACMKISSYYKTHGHHVELVLNYDNLQNYDKVFISKVFTDTPIDKSVLELPNVQYGGTGFYFDKAPNLPYEIEHHFPDYHLYDNWVNEQLHGGGKKSEYKGYTDYSIGFLTRGCFRKCAFCVNQKYDRVFQHSSIDEFYDPKRKKICLLDDNFLGFPHWKEMLLELQSTGKPFKFKQGLDERLLTDEKCEILFQSKYDGEYTFAFDSIDDYDLIERKLKLIRKYNKKNNVTFYVLCGFNGTDYIDIKNTLARIELLLRYGCLPYIMRYQSKDDKPYLHSKWKGLYNNLARWCNQPSMIKSMSYREFCNYNQSFHKTKGTLCSAMQSLVQFEQEHPDIAKKYFDMKFVSCK